MAIMLGLDVGQKLDPTAMAVVEQEVRKVSDRAEKHFVVRHLARLRLGTPYPEVARQVGETVDRLRERAGEPPAVYVDATGVGQPIVDLLRARAVPVVACQFTRGRRRKVKSGGEVVIGKAYLVSRLLTLFESGRLHLPRNPEAAALARELTNYEIRVSRDATDRYGAFRSGTHDDLVTALALAVQVEDGEAPAEADPGPRRA